MDYFEFETRLECAENFYPARRIEVGDSLDLSFDHIDKIKVYFMKQLVGFIPREISLKISFLRDKDSFIQTECISVNTVFDIRIRIVGFTHQRLSSA